ncbi:hypothetical protein Dimus_032122 [Dionaea muscipula]
MKDILKKSVQRGVPEVVRRTSMDELNTYWRSSEYVALSETNRANRNTDVGGYGPVLHIGGSIPITAHKRKLETFVRLRDEALASEGGESSSSSSKLQEKCG